MTTSHEIPQVQPTVLKRLVRIVGECTYETIIKVPAVPRPTYGASTITTARLMLVDGKVTRVKCSALKIQ